MPRCPYRTKAMPCQEKRIMDKSIIALIIVGIASIGVAILSKVRPDLVWKNRQNGNPLLRFRVLHIPGENGVMASPQRQQFGFFVLLLFGIMMLLVAGAMSVPQWQGYMDAVIISIVMVMTAILLFVFWKIMLSQDENRGRISFAIILLLAFAMIALAVYYWYVTLK